MTSFLRAKQLKQLYFNDWLVVPDFLPADLCNRLRCDLKKLRNENAFEVARIGHDGNQIQDENVPFRDIRRSESCFIGKIPNHLPNVGNSLQTSEAREELYTILNDLRDDLEASSDGTVASLDSELLEMMYLYYPNGGYYRRHCDSEQEPGCISSVREWSFVLYLNEEWHQRQGGYLRLHRDNTSNSRLPNYIDIEPRCGTLAIFRSKRMPHEVLETRTERLAIVGWFLSNTSGEGNGHISLPLKNTTGVNLKTLGALIKLRDAVPSLATRLDQPTQNDQSGMIWDDFGGPPSITQESKQKTADMSDRNYWDKICSFDEEGRITTLSLGGIRLDKISPADILDVEFYGIQTLDVAGTYIEISILSAFLSKCTSLKQLHLGGNGLGDKGIHMLAVNNCKCLEKLRSLDVRYNDITSKGAMSIASILKNHDCCMECLYLEGNDLRCEGAAALAYTGPLIELFLGQNNIGPDGAAALADGLLNDDTCLRNLYMEGNTMGPEGAAVFRKVLEKLGSNKTLEKLYADNNCIGKVEFAALGQALNSVTMIGDGGIFQE